MVDADGCMLWQQQQQQQQWQQQEDLSTPCSKRNVLVPVEY
jgi:hypothetical protein